MEAERLDYDDAISVATMKSLGIGKIVSFDRDFDGIDGISRLNPADAIPDEGESGGVRIKD
jgi:predicted nucleic acid-binding protein